jgi:hypothetical protein
VRYVVKVVVDYLRIDRATEADEMVIDHIMMRLCRLVPSYRDILKEKIYFYTYVTDQLAFNVFYSDFFLRSINVSAVREEILVGP